MRKTLEIPMDGKGFERLRKRYRVKRSDFCRWCDLDYSTVWRWERQPCTVPVFGARLLVAYIEKFRQGVSYDKAP